MSLHSHVNASGFPLQLALANAVRDQLRGEWDVLYEEHAWRLGEDTGFLDLVLENKYRTYLMNIECKRVRDSDWVFLLEKAVQANRRHAKLWITYRTPRRTHFGWADIPMDPASVETKFCVVPGQDQKARPMLERAAAELVMSTEALATEEQALVSDDYSNFRIYQNVIVTTAALHVCEVDISKIDLATGEIPKSAPFREVPFVRFRKQLGAHAPVGRPVTNRRELENAVRLRESTIFVVNAANFVDFLRLCDIPETFAQQLGVL